MQYFVYNNRIYTGLEPGDVVQAGDLGLSSEFILGEEVEPYEPILPTEVGDIVLFHWNYSGYCLPPPGLAPSNFPTWIRPVQDMPLDII